MAPDRVGVPDQVNIFRITLPKADRIVDQNVKRIGW
jgi:hypothetical protein